MNKNSSFRVSQLLVTLDAKVVTHISGKYPPVERTGLRSEDLSHVPNTHML